MIYSLKSQQQASGLKALSSPSVPCGRTYSALTRAKIYQSQQDQEVEQSRPPQTTTGSQRYRRPLSLRYLPVPLYLSGMILLWWLAWGLGRVRQTLSRLTLRGLMLFAGIIPPAISSLLKMKLSSLSAMSGEELGMSSVPMSCTKGETHGD